jgi:hypothetical protein
MENNVMKKVLICSLILLSSLSVFAIEKTRQDYIDELKDKGYLYGCTPVNMSLANPVRGGFNWAAMHGEIDIMELQVKAGLDVTSCGKNLPLILMSKKQTEAFEFLIKNGYSANGTLQGLSYLIFAEHYKNPEIVKILIDNGADVNLEQKGYTPLNYAIKKKNPEIVKMLLDAGAKPNEKTIQLVKKTKVQEIKDLIKTE